MKPVERKAETTAEVERSVLEVSQPRADDNDDNPLTVGSNLVVLFAASSTQAHRLSYTRRALAVPAK